MTKTSQVGANQPWKPRDTVSIVSYDHSEIHRDQFRNSSTVTYECPRFIRTPVVFQPPPAPTHPPTYHPPTQPTNHPLTHHPPPPGNTRTIQAAIQAAKDAQLDAAEFAKAATKELVGLIASKGL